MADKFEWCSSGVKRKFRKGLHRVDTVLEKV